MSERESESLEDRVPCPDEMCVGVIGPSGRCGTCGRAGEPGMPLPSAVEVGDEEGEIGQAAAAEGGEAEGGALDAEERVLCPDDMCTGILGPDGRCGTCGRKG